MVLCAQEMAALGLTEEAAERLVSPADAQQRGEPADTAAPAASSGDVRRKAAYSRGAAHGTGVDPCEPAGHDDINDEPSVLDGLDALDPDYWEAAPTPTANDTRPQAESRRPQRGGLPDLQLAQPSPDQALRPDTTGKQPAQPRSGADDDGSDDGGGMGLFDEDGGTEWDAPPPAAKPAVRAAPQRSTGKTKGLSGVNTPMLQLFMGEGQRLRLR